jgi:hypothetical protein
MEAHVQAPLPKVTLGGYSAAEVTPSTMPPGSAGAMLALWGFDTDGYTDGWGEYSWDIHQIADIQVREGLLAGRSIGSDPYIRSPSGLMLNIDAIQGVIVRMRVSAGSEGSVYFITDAEPNEDERKVKYFGLYADNEFHIYHVNMTGARPWKGSRLTQMRLDPLDTVGTFEIDYVLVEGAG